MLMGLAVTQLNWLSAYPVAQRTQGCMGEPPFGGRDAPTAAFLGKCSAGVNVKGAETVQGS